MIDEAVRPGVRLVRLAATLAALGAAVGLAAPALAEQPGNLTDEVTDTAGVLGDDADEVRSALTDLADDTDYQLFVAFVATFDGLAGFDWATQTAVASGMGRDDVLLAVAVEDRRYGLSVDDDVALTDDQIATIERAVEDRLGDDDWSGAALAAAAGIRDAAGGGSGSSGGGVNGLVVAAVIGLAVIGLIWFVSSRRSRERGSGRAVDPGRLPTAELGTRASGALVALDDAVKTSEQELGFAQAQFGAQATAQFEQVLATAKQQLGAAFALRQQLDDAQPETEEQARAMMTEILRLCQSADEALDAQAEAFDELRDLANRAPQVLAETGRKAEEVASRLPGARATLQSLGTTHPAAALTSVAANADQAEALLTGARDSVAQGQAAVDTDRPAAVALARAAEDAVAQAVRLLDAVDRARTDLAEAGARLDAGLASITADVADAERLAATDPSVSAAATAARAAVAEATAARSGGDQLGAVRRLTEAEAALDAALGPARAEAERAERARAQVATTLGQVGSQVRAVADFIETRRGAVGAEARTRLAEAARLAQEAERASATDPAGALGVAQRAGQLAASAQQLAEADVQQWQAQQAGPARSAGGGGLNSMVLGGILLDQVLRGGGGGGFGGIGGGGFSGGGLGGGSRRSSAGRSSGRSAGSFGGGGSRGRRGGGGRF